jgi:hypothetical protein
MKTCIGLFGTCGNSTWRKDICIPAYQARGMVDGVDYFNPQVADWKPENAEPEARHLAEDQIILFPVTGETYGTGSLAEVGFSILSAIKLEDRRDIVVYIERILDDTLKSDPVAYKESTRARALIIEHLKKQRLNNLFFIDPALGRQAALAKMAEISLVLFDNAKRIESYRTKY